MRLISFVVGCTLAIAAAAAGCVAQDSSSSTAARDGARPTWPPQAVLAVDAMFESLPEDMLHEEEEGDSSSSSLSVL